MRRRRAARLAVAFGVFVLPVAGWAAARHSSVLHPQRAGHSEQVEAIRRRWVEHRANWPRFLTDTSRNQRLLAEGLLTRPPGARRARAASVKAAGAAADTARVLLVRVGFRANIQPTLTSMDSSGDFRLEPDTSVVVDPPPHDAAYFDAQLLGLHAYFDLMSFGQFAVRGTVFPPAGEPSLKLSDISRYGPGATGQWTLDLLEIYFRATVGLLDSAAADRPAPLDLSSFDSFIFVHPGSDLQSDINRDSPNDLPSFFVTLADSIPVMGGTFSIRNGLVLPESMTQDGFVAGLLGSLCHEFGHQIGLPDWYDTYLGLPVVGEWDLMDSGNSAFFAFQEAEGGPVYTAYGLLPTGMSTVDRMLLGWDEPYVVRAPEDRVVLRPTTTLQGSGPRAARLDVSPDEYFIVENRRDLLAERLGDATGYPYLNRDATTGVVLWMSKDDPDKPSRERSNSGEYDFWIPAPSAPLAPDPRVGPNGEFGFGLIVWHVDERVLADGYALDAVNVDERMRALRIVEASGDYEIGDWRMPTAGFSGDAWNDTFRQGYYTELRATTVPNNWNSDWAHTGWEITDVAYVAPESQALSVRVIDGIPGWPVHLGGRADSLPPLEPSGAMVADVGGRRVLVVADSAGIWTYGPTGGRRVVRTPILPASLAYIPSLAPGDSVGTLAALDTSRVWLWEARVVGDSLPVRSGFPLPIDPSGDFGGAGEHLVLYDASVAVPGGLVQAGDGSWLGFEVDGTPSPRWAPGGLPIVGRFATGDPPLVAAFVRDSTVDFDCLCSEPIAPRAPPGPARAWPHGLDAPDSLLLAAGGSIDPRASLAQVVVLRRDGALRVLDPEQGVLPGFRDLPRDGYLGLALGDLNGDGELDIVAASSTHVVVETSRGALLLEAPAALREVFAVQNPVRITAGPLVADVAGDSLPEILVGTDLGLVYALDASLRPVAGYPRKLLPDLFPATLLAADVDADGEVDIVGVNEFAATAVSPAGGSARATWAAGGGGPARSSYAPASAPVQVAARLRARERPLSAYPNPAREGLVQLRITADSPGPFALGIYNLEGQKVFERSGTLRPGTQEIPWPCGSLAPGVYLCRFVSAAAGVPNPVVQPITLLR